MITAMLQKFVGALTENIGDLELKLTERKEHVFCFVAGFIPFSLNKIYFGLSWKTAKAVQQVITTRPAQLEIETRNWSQQERPFYCKRWILHLCAPSWECCTHCKNLTGAYNGGDVVGKKIQESKLILEAWDTVTREFQNKSLASSLLKLIIKK